MPVDAQAQVILDLLIAMELFSDTSVTAPDLRAVMDAPPTEEPTPVASVIDHTIAGGDGQDMTVRVYRPESAADTGPALLFFHGGGWVIGSLDSHDETCRKMANLTGYVWASVDYRLAPEAKFPAAPTDAMAALQWLHATADQHGVDTNRIAVGGDSAGGNLAAVTAIAARDAALPVAAQMLIYPCTDMNRSAWSSMQENATGYFLTADFMDWFYDQYAPLDQRTNPQAAPIHHPDLSALAPAIVLTAEFDPLRDEGQAYAQRLADAGVAVVATNYDGMFHGFFGMDEAIDRAGEAHREAAAFLQETLDV